jgi:hypothetical protein
LAQHLALKDLAGCRELAEGFRFITGEFPLSEDGFWEQEGWAKAQALLLARLRQDSPHAPVLDVSSLLAIAEADQR